MRKLIVSLLLGGPVFAALPTGVAWEVRATGNDNNGGGFVWASGSKDVSASATLAIDAADNRKVTSSAHNFGSGDVLKVLCVTAGTGWAAGCYQVTSTASNAAVLDRSPSAAGNSNLGTYDLYGGVDYTQQDAAAFSGTNLTVDATTNTLVTSAVHNFVSTDVGNLIQITAGAGWTAGFYQIVSVAANAATLDRSPAAVGTSGGTWAEGGALASPGKLLVSSGPLTLYFKIFIKYSATPYTTSSALTVPSGLGGSPAPNAGYIVGYETTRADSYDIGHLNRPMIQASSGSFVVMTLQTGVQIQNMMIDCNGHGTGGIAMSGGYSEAYNNLIKGCTFYGIAGFGNAGNSAVGNEITAFTNAATLGINNVAITVRNWVHDSAGASGYLAISNTSAMVGGMIAHNVVTNLSAAAGCSACDGIVINYAQSVLSNTIYNVSRDGIVTASNWIAEVIYDNVVANAGRYGLNSSTGAIPASPMYDGNCFYGIGTANFNNINLTSGIAGATPYAARFDVSDVASPYVNASGGDFRLAAASTCRGAGLNGPMPNGLAAGKASFGAMGAAEAAASSGGAFTFVR